MRKIAESTRSGYDKTNHTQKGTTNSKECLAKGTSIVARGSIFEKVISFISTFLGGDLFFVTFDAKDCLACALLWLLLASILSLLAEQPTGFSKYTSILSIQEGSIDRIDISYDPAVEMEIEVTVD